MLIGYPDRLTVGPGGRIEFKISSDRPFELGLVRLTQGDDAPTGPGYVEYEIDAQPNGAYPALEHPTPPGSYVPGAGAELVTARGRRVRPGHRQVVRLAQVFRTWH
jgi:N,N-dimethylformamidase